MCAIKRVTSTLQTVKAKESTRWKNCPRPKESVQIRRQRVRHAGRAPQTDWKAPVGQAANPDEVRALVSCVVPEFLEKAMAPHSSIPAWKIPWTEEPGRLQSMGSQRVGRDWPTSLSLFTFMHWRRQWQPAPVFLPGESQGWGSLVGCCLWGRTESDTTEATQQQQQHS